jgi:hypothetical protein
MLWQFGQTGSAVSLLYARERQHGTHRSTWRATWERECDQRHRVTRIQKVTADPGALAARRGKVRGCGGFSHRSTKSAERGELFRVDT